LKKLLLLVLLLTSLAHADELVLDGGLGVFDTKGTSISQNKYLKLGLQEDLWGAFKQRMNVGFWLDNRGAGYSNAGFVGYQIGFEVTNSVFQMSIFSGPTLISSTDSQLGGVFQFNETLFLGIVDKNGNAIGPVYSHFSSAGIEFPNQGRDYFGLLMKFPLY
jgi:hypothetical protein